ncbi:MAG: hypothetical protein ACK53Y_14425, partial [bacterium]
MTTTTAGFAAPPPASASASTAGSSSPPSSSVDLASRRSLSIRSSLYLCFFSKFEGSGPDPNGSRIGAVPAGGGLSLRTLGFSVLYCDDPPPSFSRGWEEYRRHYYSRPMSSSSSWSWR